MSVNTYLNDLASNSSSVDTSGFAQVDHKHAASDITSGTMSIARGGALVDFPDFTRGQWINRKPAFAL